MDPQNSDPPHHFKDKKTTRTIQIPTQFAQYLYDLTGINTGSKGYWEIKSGNNIWVEGNIFRGWFSSLTVTVANQTGAAPWTTIDNLTIRNNLIEAFTSLCRLLLQGVDIILLLKARMLV